MLLEEFRSQFGGENWRQSIWGKPFDSFSQGIAALAFGLFTGLEADLIGIEFLSAHICFKNHQYFKTNVMQGIKQNISQWALEISLWLKPSGSSLEDVVLTRLGFSLKIIFLICAIDLFIQVAGPTEIGILADGSADPKIIATDLVRPMNIGTNKTDLDDVDEKLR